MGASWLVVVVAVAVSAGCGDNDLETTLHGGSRLALGWYVADDGTRAATGAIHDLETDTECYALPWSDGVTRCTRSEGIVAYSDAQCTQRVVLGTTASAAVDYDEATCRARGLYETGPANGGMQWYYASPHGCVGPYTASEPLHDLGAEVDRATLPTLTVTSAGGGRLRQAYFTSVDGLRTTKEVRDTELGVACYPSDTACMPNTTGGQVFADDQCSRAIVAYYGDGCTGDPPIAAVPDRLCSDVTHYYRLGAKVASPGMIYMLDSNTNTCTASASDATAEYHQLGEPVTQQLLAPMRSLPPGRRLEPIYEVGGGLAAPSGRFFDPDLGAACAFQLASDGVVRCVPNGNSVNTFFSDPSCQHAISVIGVSHPSVECGVTPPPPVFATRYIAAGLEVDQVKGPYTGELYVNTGQVCARTSEPLLALYEVGGAIAPATFVAATLTYE